MKLSISRQYPIIGTKWLLKKNIEIGEEKLKDLKKLYSKLNSGEKIKIAKLPSVSHYYIFPTKKGIGKEIKNYEQRLPLLRKRLKEVM
jgi:hypothetical protein